MRRGKVLLRDGLELETSRAFAGESTSASPPSPNASNATEAREKRARGEKAQEVAAGGLFDRHA